MEGLLKPLGELTYDQLVKAYNLHRNQCIDIADRIKQISGDEAIESKFEWDTPPELNTK